MDIDIFQNFLSDINIDMDVCQNLLAILIAIVFKIFLSILIFFQHIYSNMFYHFFAVNSP